MMLWYFICRLCLNILFQTNLALAFCNEATKRLEINLKELQLGNITVLLQIVLF